MTVEELLKEYDANRERLLEEYFSFLRIPSISSEAGFAPDVRRCSGWVENFLGGFGAKVERWEGNGHPVIFGERLTDPRRPTLLIYGHYDVQPVDPLDLWTSPPFEPAVRDGEVYARGAQDNKGQCFYTLAAVRTLVEKCGQALPNLKFVIEGEEETGSTVLNECAPKNREKLKADGLIVPDVGIKSIEIPSITLGARGITTMTVTFTGSDSDMHSGMVGGLVYNPNRALVRVLSMLHDDHNRVAIPGFYDDVLEPDQKELALYDLSFDESRFRREFGADPGAGEKNYEPMIRAWLRPTLELNGIGGGYTGSGFKTVIPAMALAKISCRLVPNQRPQKIAELVKQFILKNVPAAIQARVTISPGFGKPLRTNPDSRIAKLAERAFTEVYGGKDCTRILTGGSIPVITELAEAGGAEAVFLGYGLDTDAIHAPNEHFGLDRLRLGFATIGRLVQLFGE